MSVLEIKEGRLHIFGHHIPTSAPVFDGVSHEGFFVVCLDPKAMTDFHRNVYAYNGIGRLQWQIDFSPFVPHEPPSADCYTSVGVISVGILYAGHFGGYSVTVDVQTGVTTGSTFTK